MFDLDAVASEGKPFQFKFGGEEYEFPPDLDLKLVALLGDLAESEDPSQVDVATLMAVAKGLFGPEQWDRLEASPSRFGVRKLIELMNAYMKHMGVGLGELQASTGSSKSTVRPSKRTSNGSTKSRSRS
jgi:hypothetical protein